MPRAPTDVLVESSLIVAAAEGVLSQDDFFEQVVDSSGEVGSTLWMTTSYS
jgi:hypothetical protein